MINVNAPFIIALTIIIFLVVIKWIEWFLFKNGSFPALRKFVRTEHKIKEKKDSKLSAFGRKLKDLLFFGKADLQKPWYGGIPFGVIIFGHSLATNFVNITFWKDMAFFWVCIIAASWFSVYAMLRANREFFAEGDRRKRFIRTQIAQGSLTLLIVAVVVSGVLLYSNHKDPDPAGLKESVDWVIEPVYDAEWPEFSEGLAAVGYRGKKGYIDKNGEFVIRFQYNDADNFHEGLAAVQKDWRWGYIDHSGNTVIPFQYDEAFEFDGGIAPVKKDGKWCVIGKDGKVLLETGYSMIYPFHEGVAKVETKDKQYKGRTIEGLIDTGGKPLLQNGCGLVGNFSEGCIFAFDNESGLGYFYDKSGEKAIAQNYVYATDFSGGYAAVSYLNGECAIIDHSGNIIRKLDEDDFNNFLSCQEGLVMINNGKWDNTFGMTDKLKYGFKDIFGDIMLPVVFSSVTPSSEGLIGLEVDGLWGFIENPLPEAARNVDSELWKADRTQIAAVEGLPVYAGELESRAYSIKESDPKQAGLSLYKTAFEQIKSEKAYEKYGKNIDPDKIRYQIGDTYYKKLLLPNAT